MGNQQNSKSSDSNTTDNNDNKEVRPSRAYTASIRRRGTGDVGDFKKYFESKYKKDEVSTARRERLASDRADVSAVAPVLLGDQTKRVRKFKSRLSSFWDEYNRVVAETDGARDGEEGDGESVRQLMSTSKSKSLNEIAPPSTPTAPMSARDSTSGSSSSSRKGAKKLSKDVRSLTINPKMMRRQKRERVLEEIVESEKLYAKFLDLFLYKFIIPIRSLVSNEEATQLFCNIESIIPFHTMVLSEMSTGMSNVVPVLLKYSAYLKLYTPYVNNYETALNAFARLMKENKKLSALLTSIHDDPEVGGLQFLDFLIMPVQRIPRYRLLLESLRKHTKADDREMSDLNKTLVAVCAVAKQVNESKRNFESITKVVDVQRRISGDYDLLKEGRQLVREGEATVWKPRSQRSKPAHVFLFNDILLWTSAAPDYKFKGVMKLTQVRIVDCDDADDRFEMHCEDTNPLILGPVDWRETIDEGIKIITKETKEQRKRRHKRRNDVHSAIASQLQQLSAR